MEIKRTYPRKILVLEKDDSLRDTLVEALTLEGYDLNQAKTGYAGIELAKKHLPDLIICASQFSDLSCWDIFKQLRKEKPTRHIRFICLSSRILRDEYERRMEGVTIIRKPFKNKKLVETILANLSSFY